jgi:hypothetical protein
MNKLIVYIITFSFIILESSYATVIVIFVYKWLKRTKKRKIVTSIA